MSIGHAEVSTKIIVAKLSHLPELQPIIHVAKVSPELFKPDRVFVRYIKVVDDMTELSPDDRDLIGKANRTIHQPGADIFLQMFTRAQKNSLTAKIYEASNPQTHTAKLAKNALFRMVEEAQVLVKEGLSPTDNDPRFKDAIWGYTQIKGSPTELLHVMTHFFTCHYIERLLLSVLSVDGLKFDKDLLLNSMGDVITLKATKYGSHPVFPLWHRPKDQAGLGWISDQKVKAYQQMFT